MRRHKHTTKPYPPSPGTHPIYPSSELNTSYQLSSGINHIHPPCETYPSPDTHPIYHCSGTPPIYQSSGTRPTYSFSETSDTSLIWNTYNNFPGAHPLYPFSAICYSVSDIRLYILHVPFVSLALTHPKISLIWNTPNIIFLEDKPISLVWNTCYRMPIVSLEHSCYFPYLMSLAFKSDLPQTPTPTLHSQIKK